MTHKCEMKTPFASVLHASKFRFEIGYHGIWTWYTIFSTKNEEEKDSIRLMRIGRVRGLASGTPASSWQGEGENVHVSARGWALLGLLAAPVGLGVAKMWRRPIRATAGG